MKVAFAGTPDFAAVALRAILEDGFNVPLVLTQPDRPAGRGMQLQPSPVKQLALQRNIAVDQPEKLRLPEQQAALRDCQPDVLVVAAYGLILPQTVLDIPRYGCLNIHASLLPRWRGAAPIHRAIESGDAMSGVTIMQMEAGLDTGPMLLVDQLPIKPAITTGELHDGLAVMGGALIVRALRTLRDGQALTAIPQPEAGVTYAHKIEKAEAQLDFSLDAVSLQHKVHAFNPFPGCFAAINGQNIKFWTAIVVNQSGEPGVVLQADGDGVVVACGRGALRFTTLQKPGGKRLPAAEFLRGFALSIGDCFLLPDAN